MISYIVTIIIALIGFMIASMIRHKKKVGQPLVCPIGSDCESVVYSTYSKFLGIDITNLGVAYYGFIAALYGIFIVFAGSLPDYLYVIGFLLSVGAVVFSMYLVIVQTLVIRQWCFWCILSALTSVALLIASGSALGSSLYPFLLEYKTVIVVMHALAAALGVGTVIVTDVFFMKFLKDYKISASEADILDTLSQVVWFALGLLILTGVALFLPTSAEYLAKTKFVAKVVILGVVIVNGIMLNLFVAPKLVKISFGEEGQDYPHELHHLRKFAFAFGGVSIVSWISTFILGSLRSLPISVLGILLIYLFLVLTAVIGSQIFEYKLVRHKI
ncbi:MAG TPA: vitamin K epoxide reductase family protein [Candidatus Paceibacterota bacterium]|nr:vitamin K epoxide reductase family protein [Candidatus Paceibacterota bacterium]